MFEALINWWKSRNATEEPEWQPPVRTVAPRPKPARAAKAQPQANPNSADFDIESSGEIESLGPGKNVLIRNKYVREETGTHETLKILDDSMLETNEEDGIDPYNTGGFDRSRNWDTRFRK